MATYLEDVMLLLMVLAVLCLVFAVGGAIVDGWAKFRSNGRGR
jgi:hypothetical protein